jgi:hypothetical protein
MRLKGRSGQEGPKMRPIPKWRRLLTSALACAALLVAISIAPAFGLPQASPTGALKFAQQALRLAKRADGNAKHALAFSKKPGPAGAQGPRGSEGIDGPSGADGHDGPPGTDGRDGPRGATGPSGPAGTSTTGADGATGPQGPQGPQGSQGSQGARGPEGPRGLVRAYATVSPEVPAVVAARADGVTGLSRPSDDHYCLTVDGTIDVDTTSPVVTVDLAYSTGAPTALFAAIDSVGGACGAGKLEVVTAGPTANAVGFTIVIP